MKDVLNLEWIHKKLEDEKEIWDLGQKLGAYSKSENSTEEGEEELKEEWKRVQAELDNLLEDEQQTSKEIEEVERELVQFEKDRQNQLALLKETNVDIENKEKDIEYAQRTLGNLKGKKVEELDEELKYFEERESSLNREIKEWEEKIIGLTNVLENETRETKEVAKKMQEDLRTKVSDLEDTLERK
jgi:chromosome segregation ATPase